MQASQVTLPVVVIDGVAYIVSGERVLFKCDPSDITATETLKAVNVAHSHHQSTLDANEKWEEARRSRSLAAERATAFREAANEINNKVRNHNQTTEWERAFSSIATGMRHRVKATRRAIANGGFKDEYAGYADRMDASWEDAFKSCKDMITSSWRYHHPRNKWIKKFGNMLRNMRQRNNSKDTNNAENKDDVDNDERPDESCRQAGIQVLFDWARADDWQHRR